MSLLSDTVSINTMHGPIQSHKTVLLKLSYTVNKTTFKLTLGKRQVCLSYIVPVRVLQVSDIIVCICNYKLRIWVQKAI